MVKKRLLNIEKDKDIMKRKESLISFFLRAEIALVFLYAAISSFLNPSSWVGFVPLFLRNLIDANLLLILFSMYETMLGVWLLSNKAIFNASLLSAITMLAIIIPNFGALDIIFRDIAILFSAIALLILSHSGK